ncbi:MAG: hypothetical protein ABR936_01910 [Bacteroidota bacterium]|jgi:hypothetical protein
MIIKNLTENSQKGCAKLYSLDSNVFDELFNSIIKTNIVFSVSNLAKKVAHDIGVLSTEEIENIFRLVSAIIHYKERYNESYNNLIKDIIRLAKEKEIAGIEKYDDKSLNILSERILKLSNNEQIFYAIRSYDLYTEHAFLFMAAMGTVDVRPIFNFDKKDQNAPKFGIISPVLHIHYHAEEDHRDVYFAIDKGDIAKIRIALDNIENQMKLLETTFEKLGMIELKPEVEID